MSGLSGNESTDPNSDLTPVGITQELFFARAFREQLLANRGRPKPRYPIHRPAELSLYPENFFGLAECLGQIMLGRKRISELYDWQKEILSSKEVENRQNLIISMPTSGGKTVVAEILAMREVILNNKDVIFVEPFVAIVQEKIASLAAFVRDFGCQVAEYADRKGSFPPAKSALKKTIFVATIEKAAGLVDSFLEDGRLSSEIGLICVDELHLIGQERGEILESMLTKVMFSEAKIHVVGMSATIGNPYQLCSFLKASLYTADVRPTPLQERVLCGENVSKCVREKAENPLQFERKVILTVSDPEYVAGLAKEAVQKGPCLIFCPTRAVAENVAVFTGTAEYGTASHDGNASRNALLRALKVEGFGRVCPKLKQTIPFGVAYHHAGMTVAERQLLEEAFHIGTIICLTCTSTLAAGVNLPARTVIIRSPYSGMQFLTVSQYRQMIGRAGRTGQFAEGDSYLICRKEQLSQVAALLSKPVENCNSRLVTSGESAMLALGAIVIGLAETEERLIALFNCSFFKTVSSSTEVSLGRVVDAALAKLKHIGALLDTGTGDGSELKVTKFGKALYRGNLSVKEGKLLLSDLKKAAESLNVTNLIHRLYLVIPYKTAENITLDGTQCFQAVSKMGQLNGIESKALESTKVSLGRVGSVDSSKKPRTDQDVATIRVCCCLMLHRLFKEDNLWDVSDFFNVPRGEVLALKTAAATFAGRVARFSKEIDELEWAPSMFAEMSEKIYYACCTSLRPLLKVPYFRLGRARQFVRAGFATVEAVADADVNILVERVDYLPRKVAEKIISCAKLLKEEDDAMNVAHAKIIPNSLQGGSRQVSSASEQLQDSTDRGKAES